MRPRLAAIPRGNGAGARPGRVKGFSRKNYKKENKFKIPLDIQDLS